MQRMLKDESAHSAASKLRSTADTEMSQRTARFYKLFAEKPLAPAVELRLLNAPVERPAALENPFVITTLIAGIAGVTITIIIILSIWILSRARVKGHKGIGSHISNQNGGLEEVVFTSDDLARKTAILNPNYAPPQSQRQPEAIQPQIESEAIQPNVQLEAIHKAFKRISRETEV